MGINGTCVMCYAVSWELPAPPLIKPEERPLENTDHPGGPIGSSPLLVVSTECSSGGPTIRKLLDRYSIDIFRSPIFPT